MAGVIQRVGHCRLNQKQKTGDLFNCLAEAILYQQLSGKAAATIHGRFLQLYPPAANPTAEDILNTGDEALRSIGISRSKVIYLKDLAQHCLNGLPSIEQLEDMEDETIIQVLTPIKGVGRWTVQMLLIFRLHRWNVLPIDDLGIRTAVRQVYGLADLPDRKTVDRLGQPWHPYRTIATWYLWRSLDLTA